MAWLFQIWIETETVEEGLSIKEYFNNRTIHANGKTYSTKWYPGGMVTVDGISTTGVNSESDALEMTSVGLEFYELLIGAPKYRFALVGIEVDGWREFKDLEEDPKDVLTPGFVIREDLYKQLGSPGKLIEFNTGYLWTPYHGEHLITSRNR